jgi:hypothetical protein
MAREQPPVGFQPNTKITNPWMLEQIERAKRSEAYSSDNNTVREKSMQEVSELYRQASSMQHYQPDDGTSKEASKQIKAKFNDPEFMKKYNSPDQAVRDLAMNEMNRLFYYKAGDKPVSDDGFSSNTSAPAPSSPQSIQDTILEWRVANNQGVERK